MKRFLLIISILFFVSTSGSAGLVEPVNGSPQILIPAAASTAGANGTFFRSDITIINLASRDQSVELRWLPAAGSGQPVSKTITIAGTGEGHTIRSSDFVNQYLGVTGLGAILVTALDSSGGVDPGGRLYVATRVWTPQPGTSGTTSQSFPTLPVSAIHTSGPVVIPSMGSPDNTGSYRTNLGIVNLDPLNSQIFRVVTFFPGVPDKFSVVMLPVPPMSMIQGAIAPLELQPSIENVTSPATRSALWTAYGSTIDNVTGSAWSELAVSTDLQALPSGHWAGNGMCVDAKDSGTAVVYECSTGAFPLLFVDSDGHIEADGTWTTSVGPAVIQEPAHLSGVVQGTTLTITIHTTGVLGPITVQSGATTPCGVVCV